ncbi:MAG: hypothetical protein ACKVIR_08490 [Candidatus Poseidoniales archaeon]
MSSEQCNAKGCHDIRKIPTAFCSHHLKLWRDADGSLAESLAQLDRKANEMIFSTGGFYYPYDIIDVIFAHKLAPTGWLFGPNAKDAFSGIKQIMAQKAANMDGDAILFCNFNHRNVSQGVEIWGTGTVVKIEKYKSV